MSYYNPFPSPPRSPPRPYLKYVPKSSSLNPRPDSKGVGETVRMGSFGSENDEDPIQQSSATAIDRDTNLKASPAGSKSHDQQLTSPAQQRYHLPQRLSQASFSGFASTGISELYSDLLGDSTAVSSHSFVDVKGGSSIESDRQMHWMPAGTFRAQCEKPPATDKMEEIRSYLFRELNPGKLSQRTCYALFKVEWPLGAFLRSQNMDADTPIGRVVTITGSALDCRATTCEEYLSTTWPSRGLRFLHLLQYALDSTDKESQGALIS